MSFQISILGQLYSVSYKPRQSDKKLETLDGYVDLYAKKIVVCDFADESKEVGCTENIKCYQEEVLRHEIVHAFAYESGARPLNELNEEQLTDWIAIMAPKINEAINQRVVKLKSSSECR